MIAVLDYGSNNSASILNMIKKSGGKAYLCADKDELINADAVILPGVGAFDNGMYNLIESGILDVLEAKALVEKVPVLGICLGMQMLFDGSEEGKLDGLGWLKGKCVRFDDKKNPGLKVPHMGWNEVRVQNKNELFENLVTNARFYHVHSYKVVCADSRDITAVCHYGEDFTCAVSRGNIYGVQFHPEKSHKFGIQFFKNFLRLVKND